MTGLSVWFGMFLIGAVAAFLLAWVVFAAFPVMVFFVVVIAIDAGARSRWGGGVLGFGLTLGAMAFYQGASCPAVTRFEGGTRWCEDGPDVRVFFVVAALAIAWGAVVTVRQFRRRPQTRSHQ